MLEDEGWTRRARIFQTAARFVPKPTLLTENACDDTLKPRINKGAFNPHMLYFIETLYPSLDSTVNPGTELAPKPPEMKLLEQEMQETDEGKPTVAQFLEQKCERVSAFVQGTAWGEFKAALGEHLGLGKRDSSEVRTALTRAGIKRHPADKKHVPVDATGAWRLKSA